MTENHTQSVSSDIFRQVYDSPASLPGDHRWVTSDPDGRKIEEILGMPPHTIGAPFWVSGDRMQCADCGRVRSWLDIVSSALEHVHRSTMIARVILGSQKFVNTEAPTRSRIFSASNAISLSTTSAASNATIGHMPTESFWRFCRRWNVIPAMPEPPRG
jgi:hypothetical protein